MSPTMAAESPSRWPRLSRIVRRSRSAWVGCSCMPSPALTTEQRSARASMWGAPDAAWRSTTQSGLIASRFRAVSISVSPLTTLDDVPETLITSAESHFPAISNEVRVRVDGSRKRFTTVLPRRAGTFLISRDAISFMEAAVSRIVWISPGSRLRISSRSFRVRPIGALPSRLRFLDDHPVLAIVLAQEDLDGLPPGGRQVLAHVVGADRQLAVAAVDQHGQLDHARAAQVDQRVQRGPDRPAGVEDVVDQDDRPVGDREGDVGPPQHRGLALAAQVVAVERDVEGPDRDRLALDRLEPRGDAAGQQDAAGPEPDQRQLPDAAGPLDDLVGDPGEGAVDPRVVEDLGLLADGHRRGPGTKMPSPGPGEGALNGRTRLLTRLSLWTSPGPLKGVTACFTDSTCARDACQACGAARI